MQRFLTAAVLAFLSAGQAALAEDALTLAREGKSDYVIVLPEQPTPQESTAARELQEHLEKATGAKLPVVPESQAKPEAPEILIGATARLKTILPELDLAKLGPDGIALKTVGNDLVLAGQGKRGTLYAVYTFLEDAVGCRWWTSTESFAPKKPTLSVAKPDHVYAPKLRIREAFYRDAFEGVFAARSKCNGHSDGVPEEYGGHERFALFVHTFYPLLPPEKYFAEHPDWYSEIDGKRKHEGAQLCVTNEAMRAELIKNTLARLAADPTASAISISQNDWHGRCQCAKCKALEESEGSPSGPLLHLVNAVAEAVEKERPGVLVETLAYQYTRKPPKNVRPRANVVVRLCSIECSFVQPLVDGPQNAPFRADIEPWSQVAPQLYVWDYVTNFSNYLVPHPNLRVLGPNIRYFVDHNVIALFEQGDAGSSIGDFVRLRAWLIAHLMWDPSRDEKALIREFLEGYYGPAAPHLAAYLDVIQDAGARSGKYLGCFLNDTAGWLTLDDLNKATEHFQKATAAVADQPELARRVRRERMVLDHVWLRHYHELKKVAQAEGKPFLGPADPVAACEEFIRLANEFQVGQWREGVPFANYEADLRARVQPPAPK